MIYLYLLLKLLSMKNLNTSFDVSNSNKVHQLYSVRDENFDEI